jgi:hypothetical protein
MLRYKGTYVHRDNMGISLRLLLFQTFSFPRRSPIYFGLSVTLSSYNDPKIAENIFIKLST